MELAKLDTGDYFVTEEDKELLKTVEEMRNEFLDIEEVELPLKVNGKIDWKKTAELMELRNIIRLKWFKRWLAKKSGTS